MFLVENVVVSYSHFEMHRFYVRGHPFEETLYGVIHFERSHGVGNHVEMSPFAKTLCVKNLVEMRGHVASTHGRCALLVPPTVRV
jgi:hypothetical protein